VATIGIDLGGTKIQGARVDHGRVVADVKVVTPTGGVDEVVTAVADCVRRLSGHGAVAGVGVGAPGVVDAATGDVVRAPNLPGFEDRVPLAARLSGVLDGIRVVVDNDVNVAVLAEHRLGAARESADVLGVWVGTGVGGGLVLDGRVRRGPVGGAGEIGHMAVAGVTRRCGCGQVGHLEAVAGRAAMEGEARRRHEAGEHTALVELAGTKRMKSSVFAKALEAGDRMAGQLLDDAVVALGTAVASAVALVDLDLVVMGGGLADKLGRQFVGRVEQAVRGRLFVPTSGLRVVPGALGDLAGAMGAALLLDE
jgi:glucokinase